MFGLKIFAKAKTQKFASDKERKQYYAIQGYYKKRNRNGEVLKAKSKADSKSKEGHT